jgi:hypothetical protein
LIGATIDEPASRSTSVQTRLGSDRPIPRWSMVTTSR